MAVCAKFEVYTFFIITTAMTVVAGTSLDTISPFITKETASLFMMTANSRRGIGEVDSHLRDVGTCSGYNTCGELNHGMFPEEYQTRMPKFFTGKSALVDIEVDKDGGPYTYRYKRTPGKYQRQRKGIRPTGILWHKQSRSAPASPCSPNPCMNSGICTNTGSSYSCACTSGWSGSTCGTDYDECSSNPCQNGGTCTDHFNGYTCQCRPGWTGTHCESDIDECASNPCQNNATCNNQENFYTCTCTEDFSGVNCENDTCDPIHQSGADVVFVVDSTISQGQSLFDAQKQYIKDFIGNFPIGPTQYQIALVSFSFKATIHCYLNTHSNSTSILNEIDNMTFTNGPSYTAAALQSVREDVLTATRGTRSTATSYVIVLTDGLSFDTDETVGQATLLKASGTEVFTVAFGQQIYHTELLGIANNRLGVFPSSLPDAVFSVMKKHLPSCPDCTWNTSDVIVLIDASTDLPPTTFYPSIDALKTMVAGMTIGVNNVHVNYIKYAKDVHEQFDFTEYQTTDNVITQIVTRLTQSIGPANLSKALEYVANNGFTTAKGARSNARQFVVAFTQGNFDDFAVLKNSAEELRNSGVTLAAVGTGNDVNMTSLLEIASDPAFVFAIGDAFDIEYDVLQSLSSSLEFNVCEFD